MNIERRIVTPVEAALMLEANTNNRPLNKSRVAALVRAIKRNEWKINGDTIRLSKTGRLLDGQHRLAAIVESNTPVQTFVATGLDDDTFDTIDIGKPRRVSDILSVAGHTNTIAKGSIARAFLMWKANGHPVSVSHEFDPTPHQVAQFADGNETLSRAATVSTSDDFIRRFMSASVAGFVYMVGAEINEEMTREFFRQVGRSTGPRHSSVDLLRDRLMTDRANKTRMTRKEKFAISIKAFRAFLAGKEVRTLRVSKNEKDVFVV